MKSQHLRLIFSIALVLLLPAMSFAVILFLVESPQDDSEVRRTLSGCLGEQCKVGETNVAYPELKSLNQEYTAHLQQLVTRLEIGDAIRIFGNSLATVSNWWGDGVQASWAPNSRFARAKKEKSTDLSTNNQPIKTEVRPKPAYPVDLVLPLFAPEMWMISGLHSTNPADNKNHTDLHAIGDIGYFEIYYSNDGQHPQTGILYFRADDQFIPLKSTNDIPRRLQWEKKKFAAMKNWLQEHGAVPRGVISNTP